MNIFISKQTTQHDFVFTLVIQLPQRIYSKQAEHYQAYDGRENTTLVDYTNKANRGIWALQHAMLDQVGLVLCAWWSRQVCAGSRPLRNFNMQ